MASFCLACPRQTFQHSAHSVAQRLRIKHSATAAADMRSALWPPCTGSIRARAPCTSSAAQPPPARPGGPGPHQQLARGAVHGGRYRRGWSPPPAGARRAVRGRARPHNPPPAPAPPARPPPRPRPRSSPRSRRQPPAGGVNNGGGRRGNGGAAANCSFSFIFYSG